MAGSLEKVKHHLPEANFVAVFHVVMRIERAGFFAHMNRGPGERREFAVPGDEIGVQVRFDDVSDLESLLLRFLYVDFHVALGVDHSRDALGTDHVRSVSQAGQIKLIEVHGFCSFAAEAGGGYRWKWCLANIGTSGSSCLEHSLHVFGRSNTAGPAKSGLD